MGRMQALRDGGADTVSAAELSPQNASVLAPERELHAELRRTPGLCLLTGGQTGVDTAAARAALVAGLPVHLVFPLGFLQEEGPITPARRTALRGAAMHELTSPDFRYRTWTCVYLSDVVILIDPAGGNGCQETVRAARSLGRPLLNLDAGPGASPGSGPGSAGPDPSGSISSFILRNKAQVLMIAGCRASLLASARKTRGVRARLSVVVSAALSVNGAG